ncbi:MAG TPA: ABC transporter permease [Chloroflexota bacterium]
MEHSELNVAAATTTGVRAKPRGLRGLARRAVGLQEGNLVIALLVVSAFLAWRSPVFLTERNLAVLLLTSSMVAISAVGMTILLISGEVDLSVGSLQAVVGVIAMQVMNATNNLVLGILVGLAIGVLVGLVNGVLTVRLGITSFIVTLAMLSILRASAYISTNAAVQNLHKIPAFSEIGNGYLWRIPWPVVIMVVVFVGAYLLLHHTTLGRAIYAVGGNRRAAELSGIRVNAVKMLCFVVASTLAAVSAIILLSRMNSGQNNAGFGFEFQVIGAALLGGTSLYGGQGSLVGTMLAVLLLGVLSNGIILLGIPEGSSWQVAVTGLVILIALYMDARRRRLAGEAA